MKLTREFYLRDVLTVAPELLGKTLVHRSAEGITAGRIVEVEAYRGPTDAAAHTYRSRRTARTEIFYGPGGHAYIYLIYGMHTCMNVVVNHPEIPEAILIRALEPVEGIALMQTRRGTTALTALCNGPGRLSQAMGITRALYGADLLGDTLWLEDAPPSPAIRTSPRIGIDYAGEAKDYPWRYTTADSPFLSKRP